MYHFEKNIFRQRAFAQRGLAVMEQLAQLVAIEYGIVVAFLEIFARKPGLQLVEIPQRIHAVLGQYFRPGGRLAGTDVENIEQQHRRVGHRGAPGLRDDNRVLYLQRIERFTDTLDDIGAVFVQPVIHAVGAVGAGALVVHGQATAEVDVAHGGTFLYQARVETAGFQHAAAHVANIGNLRTQVAVEKAQAVQHTCLAQTIDQAHQGRGRQTKNRPVAAVLAPVAVHGHSGLDTHPDHRLDIERAAAFDDDGQLGQGFHYKKAGNAHLPGVETQFNEFCVLVAITDNEPVRIAQLSHGNNQLRLAARLESMAVLASVIGNFFDHVALLVYLDRVDPAVAVAVGAIRNGLGEGLVEYFDAVIQQVADTQYGRHVQAAFVHTPHDLHQAHGHGLAVEVDADLDFAVVVNIEIAGTPGIDAIELCAQRGVPALGRLGVYGVVCRLGGHVTSLNGKNRGQPQKGADHGRLAFRR